MLKHAAFSLITALMISSFLIALNSQNLWVEKANSDLDTDIISDNVLPKELEERSQTPAEIDEKLQARVTETLNGFHGGFMKQNYRGEGAIRYFVRSAEMTIGFGTSQLYFSIHPATQELGSLEDCFDKEPPQSECLPPSHVEVTFPGSKPVVPMAEEPTASYYSCFYGSNPAQWSVKNPYYQKLIYRNLYDHIDLIYEVRDRQLKYEFLIYPGGNPNEIQVQWDGPREITANSGEMFITIETAQGDFLLCDSPPICYQSMKRDQPMEGAYRVLDANSYGFTVPDYDSCSLLIIDPIISYSTFLGSSDTDYPQALALDASGNVWLTGRSVNAATDFPTTPDALNTTHNGVTDVFVTKISADGSTLLYSTFLGGAGNENAYTIAFDAVGNVWFAGETQDAGTDFPTTPDALNTTHNGGIDAFVAKISVDGSALLYATFLGGSGNDYGVAVTLDATGNVWLIGQTDDAGTDFPTTPDALYATPAGGSDVFVCHLQTYHYPPESLIATTSADQPVYLLWDPPSILVDSALLTYRVYRGTTSGNYGIHIAETTQAFFVDATIPSDGTYYYAITAVNDYGESGFSNEAGITVTTPISRPMSPENLSAAPGETFIELSWAIPSNDGGSPIMGYRVYRGASSGIYTLLAVTANLNYNDTSVLPGVTYYYVVTAINAVGESGFSLEVSAMLTGSPDPAITVPEAPQNLSVTPGENYVALTWVAPSNTSGATITGYRVYRGTTQGEYVLIITTNNTVFNDTTIIGGITYYYVVSALNIMGESLFSLEVSATPSTGPPITPATITSPSAPRDLVATPGELMVILSWSAPSSDGNAEISYYRVYRGTKSGEYLLLAIAMDTNYNDTSVSGDTLYYYLVTAMNEAGESPFSNEVSVTSSTPLKSVESEDSKAPGFLAASALLGILVVIFRKNKKREPD